MRIAVTTDPFIPVPPENYGGIERVIDFLVKGLKERGHEVVLVANGLSTVDVKILPYKNTGNRLTDHVANVRTIAQLKTFSPDVIHSFGRLIYLLPFLRSSVAKIMSYQREPTIPQIKKAVKLAKKNSLNFTGCSNYISDKIKPFANTFNVYNGVEIAKYTFTSSVNANAPLIFLGRLEPVKGVLTAINAALAADRKLIIAGNIPPEYSGYFEKEIAPRLNRQITYVGPVNDTQKNDLLGHCAALLMPIQWDEPFGIVMAEAMACGTPVIGFNRGSVPEVINHGINGYRCNTQDEMAGLISEIDKIDRFKVRRETERRFASDVIVNNYLNVYSTIISG